MPVGKAHETRVRTSAGGAVHSGNRYQCKPNSTRSIQRLQLPSLLKGIDRVVPQGCHVRLAVFCRCLSVLPLVGTCASWQDGGATMGLRQGREVTWRSQERSAVGSPVSPASRECEGPGRTAGERLHAVMDAAGTGGWGVSRRRRGSHRRRRRHPIEGPHGDLLARRQAEAKRRTRPRVRHWLTCGCGHGAAQILG